MIERIQEIWVDASVKEEQRTNQILNNAKHLSVKYINPDKIENNLSSLSLSEGKRILYLTTMQGDQVKPCPATNPPYLCCQYTVINQVQQCPMDCTYCILQDYLSSPVITVNVNLESIFNEIQQILINYPKRFFRFGTGELGDSLAQDPITQFGREYIGFFKNYENCLIELKTKSINIQNLPENAPNNAVISWSLNPDMIIQKEERYATRLEQRLTAAKTCQDNGYKLGFHFDPILHFPDWESLYQEVIEKLFQEVDPSRIVWISLGSLRFPPSLKYVAEKRFPKSKILYDEMIRGMDGKMRYVRPLRIEMYQKISGWIKEYAPDVFLYFCMESESVWKQVFGKAPLNNAELDFWFAKNIHQNFSEVQMTPPDIKYYEDSDL